MSILGSLLMPQLKMGGSASPAYGVAPGSDLGPRPPQMPAAPPPPPREGSPEWLAAEDARIRGLPTQAPPAPTYSPAPGAGIVNPISELNRVLGGVR